MHVGIHYPFHDDRWAVTSQFYDVPGRVGWIPRKLFASFAAGQPGPWATLSGWTDVSSIGVVAIGRENVVYDFPPTGPFDRISVQILVAFPGGVKSTSYEFSGSLLGVTLLGAFDNTHPAPSYSIACNMFVGGASAAPLPPYVPPGAFQIRPATWSEV